MHVKHLLLTFLVILTVSGCSGMDALDFLKKKAKPLDENLSEAALYQMAQEDLENGSYGDAVQKLKALESRFPFGRYAEQAQLELVYAYYKDMEPESARSAAERFIRLHPEHPNVDYAYYLKGLSSFEQDTTLTARFLPLDMTKRDPGAARDSFTDFAQLTARYPNSRYAPDAKARMIYLRNLLAAGEIHVADYYLSRQAYVAAANRGRYVVENYQKTPSVADGLAVMAEAYSRLDLDELAHTSLQALKNNYPDYPSLKGNQLAPRSAVYQSGKLESWLADKALAYIELEGEAPPPPESNASRALHQEVDQAARDIPLDLMSDEELRAAEEAERNRPWWAPFTFGLYDFEQPVH